MPTYVYECRNPLCTAYEGNPVEIDLSARDEAPQPCLSCGQPLTRIIASSVGIAFRGPGFYSTDNRQK